jgi:acyl-CoA thioesterase-1
MIRLTDQAGATALVLPMEIPPNFGKIYTDAFRASFLEATRGTNAVLADFPLHAVALDTSLMQADGIHPTAEAQPLILDSVWMSLESLL